MVSIGLGERTQRWLSALPLLAFLGLFSLLPLAYLALYSWGHLGGVAGLWNELWGPRFSSQLARRALGNSLEQGILSAALAVLWGLPVGIFLGLRSTVGKRRLRAFLVLPFLLPSLVMVFGTLALFGDRGLLGSEIPLLRGLSSGLSGILFINVMYNAPIVALYTAAALDGVPPYLEEAARMLGASPFLAFRTAGLRPALSGAALGGTLTFLLSFLGFAPPLLVGGPSYYTLEDWIYALDKLVGFGGPALAAGLAVWALAIMALPIVGYMLLLRGTNMLGRGPDVLAAPARPGRRTSPASLFLGGATAALVVLEGLLLLSVFLLSLTWPGGAPGWANWSALLSTRAQVGLQVSLGTVIFNTLFFACVSAAIVFAVGLPLYLPDRPPRGAWGALSFLPLMISPVILALGLSLAWGSSLGSDTTVWVLIVISQASVALPMALQGLNLSFRSQRASLVGAARTLGSSRLSAFSDIKLPLARPGVRAAALFALAVGLGEFAATNFLFVPQFTTLTVEMYLLPDLRMEGTSFAVGALLVVLSLGVFGLFAALQDREGAYLGG